MQEADQVHEEPNSRTVGKDIRDSFRHANTIHFLDSFLAFSTSPQKYQYKFPDMVFGYREKINYIIIVTWC
jgi:hypothetical protein